MALSDNLKNANKEIQKLNDLGTEFKTVYQDIGTALKGLARDSKDFGTGIQDAAKLSADLAKSAQELAGYTKEDLKDRKKAQDFVRKQQSLLAKEARLQSQIRVFKQQSINATKKEQAILNKVVENLENSADYTEKIGKGFEDINKTSKEIAKSNPFKGVADLVSDIPIIGKAFGEFSKAADAFNDKLVDSGSKTKALGAGFKELGTFFTKLAIGNLVTAVNIVSEEQTSIQRGLNRTRGEAEGITSEFNKLGGTMRGITGDELVASAVEFGKSIGTSAVISGQLAADITTMSKQLGLGADSANEIAKLGIATSKNAETFTDELIGSVIEQNALTNSSIRYQDILEDVSKTNKAVVLSTQAQGKNLAQAAFQAKKMGLSMNQLDGIAGNLLDFESSIAAELEAELLTGKELNLEKARTAALNGDMATLSAEIAKQGITAEKFGKMNRIQQEAIAKALGMNREELAASLIEQKALSNLGAKDKSELNAKVKARLAEVNAIKDAEEREKARAELIKQLGGEELVRQQEAQTLAEMQAEAQKDMALAMTDLAQNILPSIESLLQKIVDNAQMFATILTGIGAIALFGKMRGLLRTLGKIKGIAGDVMKFLGGGGGGSKVATATMKTTGKKVSGAAAQSAVKAGSAVATKKVAAKATTKAVAKTGGKMLAKRIPILGSVIGLGFAIDRAMKGDYAGAAMEAGSAGLGLLDLVAPGLGTGLSLAADAGIAARDIARAGTITPTATPMATGGIVTRPTRAVVGEAGSEAVIPLNDFYAKLDELIQAVKAGGNVYLDGSKVGSTMSTSYRSVSN